jgi:uncharacterized protein (TIGR02996 family)
MSTNDALYQGILADPDDDTLRLIYADWLEENGDRQYAQFIRTQIELARVPEYDPLWVRHWFEDRDAITGRGFDGRRPRLPEGLVWGPWSYRRGLPWEVAVNDLNAFLSHAPALFAAAPVQALKVSAAGVDLSALAGSPHLARLRRLDFNLTRLPAAQIQKLQDSPHGANLTDLEFEFAGITQDGVPALLRPPLLRRLISLRLHSNDIPSSGWVEPIASAVGPFQMRCLTVSEKSRYANFTRLFGAPLLRVLRELDLAGNHLGPEGSERLAASAALDRLESLELAATLPGVPGVRVLAGCAALSGLRRLQLAANKLGPVAANALAQSPHLRDLWVLDLTNNPLGDKGAIALAESPHLTNLVQLELMHCEIGDAGAQALLESPITAGLTLLNVHEDSRTNRISDGMKRRLRQRFGSRVFV